VENKNIWLFRVLCELHDQLVRRVQPEAPNILITGLLLSSLGIGMCAAPLFAYAEVYVAGVGGINFADRINSIAGTGLQAGASGPFVDFDLKNSITYGGKVGYFPRHSWFGIEGEVLHTTPHVKSLPRTATLDGVPGIHFRLTTVGANMIARYPGRTFQPYVGAGIGVGIAHIGAITTVQSDTDVTTVWNVLAGLRAFVTPQITVFTEYKHTGASLQFDRAFGPDGGFAGNYRAQHVLAGLSYHF
jgi:opacity protein-like surface antigen